MFDKQDASDETPGEPGSSDVPLSPWEEAKLAEIRERLEPEVPQGILIEDAWLAKTLYLSLKTLQNRRAAGNKERYPIPMHYGGARAALHTRSAIIEWLARQELHHIRKYRYRGS